MFKVKFSIKYLLISIATLTSISGCNTNNFIPSLNPSTENSQISERINAAAAVELLRDVQGKPIDIEPNKSLHLVFLSIWDSYAGQGVEQDIAALPDSFKAKSQQIWIQPEINVTRAQLKEFEEYYPQVTPLVMDSGFSLMREFGFWNTPYHVVLENGKIKFKGTTEALRSHLGLPNQNTKINVQQSSKLEHVNHLPHKNSYKKLQIGSQISNFKGQTLKGFETSLKQSLANGNVNGVNIVFLDALCPMPHFPGCEKKLKELETQIFTQTNVSWLGVMSSFYIDPDIARDFVKRHNLGIPVIYDQNNKIFKQFSVHSAPYLINVDANGQLNYRSSNFETLN